MQSTTAVVFKPQTIKPTSEIVARVRELAAGGEECFDEADLRPSDEKWWRNVTGKIASSLEDTLRWLEMSTDEILATMPANATKHAYSDAERARIRDEYVERRRRGGEWVFILGMMLRDAERIHTSAINHPQSAIRARSQLRAFAVAIANVLGCVYVRDGDIGDQDDRDDDLWNT